MMMKSLSIAACATLLGATPAFADIDEMGKGNLTVGFQNVAARGLNLGVDARLDLGVFDLSARLLAPPAAVTSFFTADAAATFVGHTRRYLPIDLQPMMGLGVGILMQDVAVTGGTNTDINLTMFMPVGLRYGFHVGNIGLEANALYYLTALNSGKADPDHWHLELAGEANRLRVAGYYELGAVYNGPGVKVGFTF